jgi:hypothetical protein
VSVPQDECQRARRTGKQDAAPRCRQRGGRVKRQKPALNLRSTANSDGKLQESDPTNIPRP